MTLSSMFPLRRASAVKLIAAACCSVLICAASAAQPAAENPESAALSGKVVESIDTAGYTYALIDTGSKKVWVAAPAFPVKKGDALSFKNGMEMQNYESKTLKRKFDSVYFTGSVSVNGKKPGAEGGDQALPPGHPKIDGKPSAAPLDFSNLKKPADGKTVSEIVEGREKLKGKDVTVRGKVVKYNGGVMGKNWLHIRDGSGTAGNNDLTITTATSAKLGDTVLVKGKVSTNRDFGGGYFYAVIVEDAKVTVE